MSKKENSLVQWPRLNGATLSLVRVEIPSKGDRNPITTHLMIKRSLGALENSAPQLPEHEFQSFVVDSEIFYVRKNPGARFTSQQLRTWNAALFLPEYTVESVLADNILADRTDLLKVNRAIESRRLSLDLLTVEEARAKQAQAREAAQRALETAQAEAQETSLTIDSQDDLDATESTEGSSESMAQAKGKLPAEGDLDLSADEKKLADELDGAQEAEGDAAKPARTGPKVRLEDAGEYLPGARKGWKKDPLTLDQIANLSDEACHEYVARDNMWPQMSAEDAREAGFTPFGYFVYKKVRSFISPKPRTTFPRSAQYTFNHAFNAANKDQSELFRVYADTVNKLRLTLEEKYPLRFEHSDTEFYKCVTDCLEMIGAVRNVEFDEEDGSPTAYSYGQYHAGLELTATFTAHQFVSDLSRNLRKHFQAAFSTQVREMLPALAEKAGVAELSWEDLEEGDRWDGLYRQGVSTPKEKKSSSPEQQKDWIDKLPYAGEDYLNGRDATAQDLVDTFGFRGIQFGEWVPQLERQAVINRAYNAFMTMAHTIGYEPYQMSLNGTLGLCFGSQGQKGAAAHYSPAYRLINLTRFAGFGALAHEWGHALDDHLMDQAQAKHDNRLTPEENLVRNFVTEYVSRRIRVGRRFFYEVRNNGNHLLSQLGLGDPNPEKAQVSMAVAKAVNLIDNLLVSKVSNADYYRRFEWRSEELGIDVRSSIQSILRTLDKELIASGQPPLESTVLQVELGNSTDSIPEFEALVKKLSDLCQSCPSVWNEIEILAGITEPHFKLQDWLRENKHLKGDHMSGDPDCFKGAPEYHTVKKTFPRQHMRYLTNFAENAKRLDAQSKKSKAYWCTPVELFARSFERHVQFELKEKGLRDDYLVPMNLSASAYDLTGYHENKISGLWTDVLKEVKPLLLKPDSVKTLDSNEAQQAAEPDNTESTQQELLSLEP